VDGHRRYAEEPEPRWYSAPGPYESGVHERPEEEPRRPLTEGVDSLATAVPYDPLAGGFTRDPAAEPGRPALDAIRVPLRPTEYPAVRPGGGNPPPSSSPVSSPLAAGPMATGPMMTGPMATGPMVTGPMVTGRPFAPESPAAPLVTPYNEPTSVVPPVAGRGADGAERFAGERGGGGRPSGDGVYRTRRPVLAIVVAVGTALLMVPVLRLLAHVALASPPTAQGILPAVLLTLGLPLTGVGLFAVAGAGRSMDRAAWLRPPAGYLVVGLVLLFAAALGVG
jgi:hypothetical protein